MQIELIGFKAADSSKHGADIQINIFVQAVESSAADVILFPGAALGTIKDLQTALSRIKHNRHSIVIIEISESEHAKKTKREKLSDKNFEGLLYIIDLSISIELPQKFTRQIFATSAQIKSSPKLLGKFFTEVNGNRSVVLPNGKRATVLICGETAILHCPRDNNKIRPAIFDYDNYRTDLQKLMDKTDVFFNPIHTIQGEQGVMAQRRKFLSAGERYYFSTAAYDEDKRGRLTSKSLQYAYYNSEDLKEKSMCIHKAGVSEYISRIYEI